MPKKKPAPPKQAAEKRREGRHEDGLRAEGGAPTKAGLERRRSPEGDVPDEASPPPARPNHVAAQAKGAYEQSARAREGASGGGADAQAVAEPAGRGGDARRAKRRARRPNEAALPPPPTRKAGSKHPSAPPQNRAAARCARRRGWRAAAAASLPPPKRQSIEERASQIEQRLAAAGEDFRKRYLDSLDMSWIYHDSALEGTVYTFEELRTALGAQPPPIGDSSLQPTYDDIRRHKEAIDFVRDFGEKKRLPVTVDVIKKVFLILHPEEGDIKTVKYRKDVPQHRLYFHEYAPPDKVAYKVRQIVDWLNDPETRKTRNGIRIAARAHYDLLRVYPFANDSGKVSRLFMNLLLMRTGLPPSILHSTERQRYYEALKGSATTVLQMVQEAVENALSSVEKLLDEHETKKRAFVS